MYMKNTFLLAELADITPPPVYRQTPSGNAGKDRQRSIGQVRSRTTQKPK